MRCPLQRSPEPGGRGEGTNASLDAPWHGERARAVGWGLIRARKHRAPRVSCGLVPQHLSTGLGGVVMEMSRCCQLKEHPSPIRAEQAALLATVLAAVSICGAGRSLLSMPVPWWSQFPLIRQPLLPQVGGKHSQLEHPCPCGATRAVASPWAVQHRAPVLSTTMVWPLGCSCLQPGTARHFGREKALFPLPRSPPWAAEVPPVVVGLVVLLEPPCLRYTRSAPGYGTSCPGLVLPFCRLLWLTPWPGAAKVDKKPVLETRES